MADRFRRRIWRMYRKSFIPPNRIIHCNITYNKFFNSFRKPWLHACKVVKRHQSETRTHKHTMERRIEELEAMIADYENKYNNTNRSPWMDETYEYYENQAELESLKLESMIEELDLEQEYYENQAELNQEFEMDWMEYQSEYNYCNGVV